MNEGAGLPMMNGPYRANPSIVAGSPSWQPAEGPGILFSSLTLSYGDPVSFDGLNQLTIVASIKPTNMTQVTGMVNKRVGAANQSFSMGWNYSGGSNNLTVGHGTASSKLTEYNFDTSSWSTTSYQQIAAVLDSQLGSTQKWAVYRNAVKQAFVSQSGDTAGTIGDIATNLELGRVNNGTLYYVGAMNYAYIYNRKLSEAEIVSLASAPYQMFAAPVWRRYFVMAAAPPPPPPVTVTDTGDIWRRCYGYF